MAYGAPKNRPPYKRTTVSKPRTAKRSDARKTLAKAARSRKYATSRASSVRQAVAKQAMRNATAIRRLAVKSYGPLQVQRSKTNQAFYISNSQPVAFQLNNPAYGQIGPQLLREHDDTTLDSDGITRIGQFELDGSDLLRGDDDDHVVNSQAGRIFMKDVYLQFKFGPAFLHDCTIRIDVIRQKKMLQPDWWTDNYSKKQFMPHLMPGLKNLAGWSATKLDTKLFQVVATKRVYIDSKGYKNAEAIADALLPGGDDSAAADTIAGTTGPTKYVNMKINLNRPLRQLNSSITESNMEDSRSMNAHDEEGNQGHGSFGYSNQHPLANYWVVISTSDTSSLLDSFTGDRLQCEILRECAWRDPVA